MALRLKMRHLLLQSMILGNEVTWKSFVNSGFSSTFTFNTLVYPTNAIFSSRHLDHLEGNLSCGRLQSLQLWVKVDASGTPEILMRIDCAVIMIKCDAEDEELQQPWCKELDEHIGILAEDPGEGKIHLAQVYTVFTTDCILRAFQISSIGEALGTSSTGALR